MNYTPRPLTSEEIKELAASKAIQEAYGYTPLDGLEDELNAAYAAKFPTYATDCPDYSGPVIVIVTGILTTLVVIRRNGEFFVCDHTA